MDLITRRDHAFKLFKECQDVLYEKGKQYAVNNDVHKGFTDVAITVNVSPMQVWAVLFQKHVQAIMNAIADGTFGKKNHGNIVDAINYLAIADTMVKEFPSHEQAGGASNPSSLASS